MGSPDDLNTRLDRRSLIPDFELGGGGCGTLQYVGELTVYFENVSEKSCGAEGIIYCNFQGYSSAFYSS